MRIVAVADTHLLHEELRLPPGDVFIHAGDLCGHGTLEELARAARWIRSLNYRLKIVVAGNHDEPLASSPGPAQDVLGEGIIYLQDEGTRFEGLLFWGAPWQPEFAGRGKAFKLPRGRSLAERWALIPADVDILVTHGPPAGFGDCTWEGSHEGCEDLRARACEVRPWVHLFGHIHEDGGTWQDGGTWFVNCTICDGSRGPTLVELDLGTGAVSVTPLPAR